MILYGLIGTLAIYFILLLVSAVFLRSGKTGREQVPVSFAFPSDPPRFFFFTDKVKVSHYLTQYECPECGYRSYEHEKHCPRCLEKGNTVTMKTLTLQAGKA